MRKEYRRKNLWRAQTTFAAVVPPLPFPTGPVTWWWLPLSWSSPCGCNHPPLAMSHCPHHGGCGGCHHRGLLHVDVIILPSPCIMVVVVAVIIISSILVVTHSQSCHFSLSSPWFPAICCLPCAGHLLLALECWVSGALRCWLSGSHFLSYCCCHCHNCQ